MRWLCEGVEVEKGLAGVVHVDIVDWCLGAASYSTYYIAHWRQIGANQGNISSLAYIMSGTNHETLLDMLNKWLIRGGHGGKCRSTVRFLGVNSF